MSSIVRQQVAVAAGLRTFLREPTNVGLLVILPPLVLVAFDLALDPIAEAPGISIPPAAAELGAALFATSVLAGIVGVFQVVGAAESDRRLVVCGYRPAEVLVARLLTLLLAGAVVATLTFLVFWLRTDLTPQSPGLAITALLVAALTYGLIGVLIGAVLERELEGSLVLVFLVDFDAFSAIGVLPTERAVVDWLPLATPYNLLDDAVRDGTVATADIVVALGYLVALGMLALIAVSMEVGQ